MQTFNDLHLPEALLKSIADSGYTTPTPIQAQAIPLAVACAAGLATDTPSRTISDSISSIFLAVSSAISRALSPLAASGAGAASLWFRFFFLPNKEEKNPTDVCPLTGLRFSV